MTKQNKKIAFYGAGRCVINALHDLTGHCYPVLTDVVVYSPHNVKKAEGACMDMRDAHAFWNRGTNVNFKFTSQVSDLDGSDVVFVCTGGSPTPEEYAAAQKQGIDDRLVQGVYNINIMQTFAKHMQKSPDADIFILTNPVDLMSEVVRRLLPAHQVYGMGCYLDTMRFRCEVRDYLKQAKGIDVCLQDIQANIIGLHNGTMFVSEKDFSVHGVPLTKEELSEILDKTRQRGKAITDVNASAPDRAPNNGASWGPGAMVAKIFGALNGVEELVLPLNRKILSEESVEYGGKYAQLLCRIAQGKVIPEPMSLTAQDLKNLTLCLETYQADAERLKAYMR